MDYTEAQDAAIRTIDEPLLIVACAGSGKTQVVSQRIVEILKQPDVEPRNIVAFTFTEKAAAELKDRVTVLVQREFGAINGLAEMYIGTMHGYALDVLQTYVPETFKYGVLNEIQTRLLIDRNSTKSGLSSIYANVQGQRRALKRWVDSRLFMQVTNILREDDIDWSLIPDELDAATRHYRALLHEHRYFDFTELLLNAADLLDEDDFEDSLSGALARHVRDEIRYIVVDEYQDTNHVQERLINALSRHGANLCVVGDDDQTIYQWRGSAVSNILTFADRKHAVRTVTLDDNFRSSSGVVALGQAVAELNAGERLAKHMVAAGHQVYERGDIVALTFANPAEEAGWIASRIEDLRGASFQDAADAEARGLSWSDFAVLFRSVGKDAGPLVERFKERCIPYIIKGLTRLFDAPEIQASVCSFRYLVDEASQEEVEQTWLDAGLHLSTPDVRLGVKVLDNAKDWRQGARFSTYNIQRTYLDLLEAMTVREDRIAAAANEVTAELAFYNLGTSARRSRTSSRSTSSRTRNGSTGRSSSG